MRVTEGMRYAEVLSNLAGLSARHAQAAHEASTGIRVGKPSDDPVAAAELARLRASSSQTDTHLSTINTVRGDAELTEVALADASEIMARLKEIALQAASGGLGAEERQTLGVEVTGLKEALIQLGNTRGSRGYLFAGSQVATPAFDNAGAFQGDDVTHVVPIGNSTPTGVSTSGAESFVVTGGRNVFADVDALQLALTSNDEAGVRAAIDDITASHSQLINARARSGLVLSKLDASESVLSSLNTEEQRRAQQVGAADPFESYSRVTALGHSLERAIAVSRQILDLGGSSRF